MITKQIEKYKNVFQEWLATFTAPEAPLKTTERCCISLHSQHLSLVHVNKTPESIELLHAQQFEYDKTDNLSLLLNGIFSRYNLMNVPLYWLLPSADYQLFLIESLPVPSNELANALKWRVRSLINYPIEEAVINHFLVPAKKSTPNNPMIAVVVAKKASLANSIELFKKAELPLTVIDIPEFSLRNLTALYESDEKSTGMLYFTENSIVLNITCKQMLYFTRTLNIVPGDTMDYEQLSLEIMRYFDYFQSQWRYPHPHRLFIIANDQHATDITENLSRYLSSTLQPYTLPPSSLDTDKQQTIEKNYLLSFGCALREDKQHVSPRN